MKRLREHYVTISDDRAKKEKYYDEVLDCLEKSYSYIGGIHSNVVNNLMSPHIMWKLVTRNGKVVAVSIYKLIGGTRKVVLSGTDSSEQGKKDLRAIVREDITQLNRKTWSEVSGKMESIRLNRGAKPIPDDLAVEVMKVLGKSIVPTGDGYHYTRKLDPDKSEHVKMMVGDEEQLRAFVDAASLSKVSESIEYDANVQIAKKFLESKGYLIEERLFDIDESDEISLDEVDRRYGSERGWKYESLEEALADYIDERLDENDQTTKFTPGDIVMARAFYSPSSRSVVSSPHRILIITSAESQDGIMHYRGFELSSNVAKSNKYGGFSNSLYIKNYSTILERGAQADKEAMIIVNDLVKFNSKDLSTHGSFKGRASKEFIAFINKAYNNYKSGIDNSSMCWGY